MTVIHAETALLPDGWASDVCVSIGDDGRIENVTTGGEADTRVGILLPAPANLHSHAFQRAMAGLTERRGRGGDSDSFWTWRQLMFRFLDQLTPEDVEAIAAQVQMEMLEAGYGASVEFHYLHHQPGGVPYGDLAEMSARICAAAETSGIGLTLLPVLYSQGGVDGRTLGPGQVRFGNDIDGFRALHEGAGAALRSLPADAVLGAAPHSLRAVAPEDIVKAAALPGPMHMHLAEQVGEVEEVEAAYGARPVTWALDRLDLDPRWCLIHCTQMTQEETRALAATGAVAGLCPFTESSLGDGIFEAETWSKAGGRWGVGSDSNILISLNEELRTLEYSQRLRTKARAVLATAERSTGRVLFDGACAGGAQAAGRDGGAIAEGKWADLVALDANATDFIGRQGDMLLDTWIFAGKDAVVRDVWSAGRHLVRDGQHIRRAAILAAYRRTLARLQDAT